MKAFKLGLEQALGSGAALALLTLPACGGGVSINEPGGASLTRRSDWLSADLLEILA